MKYIRYISDNILQTMFYAHVPDERSFHYMVKGEFCYITSFYNTLDAIQYVCMHGYTISDIALHIDHPVMYDFTSFVKEISDTGAALFHRKFTESEKTYLSVKFGYPMLPDTDVDDYYTRVSKLWKC